MDPKLKGKLSSLLPGVNYVTEMASWFSPYAHVPDDVILNEGESLDIKPEFMTLVKENLKDENPMFVTFALNEGFSRKQTNVKEHKRHRFWPKEIVYEIADTINKEGTVAYDGHTDFEDLHKLQVPGAAWVRAAKGKLKDGTAVALLKGYVLPSRKDLREALTIGAINSASVAGLYKFERKKHETTKEPYLHVTEFEMLSIDFVRKHMEGMPTYKLAVSNEDKFFGSDSEEVSESMDVKSLLRALGTANLQRLPSRVTEALERDAVEPEDIIQRLAEEYITLHNRLGSLMTLTTKLNVSEDKLVSRIEELLKTAEGAAKSMREAAIAEIRANAVALAGEAFAKIVVSATEKVTTDDLVANKATFAKEQYEQVKSLATAAGFEMGSVRQTGGASSGGKKVAIASEAMNKRMDGDA